MPSQRRSSQHDNEVAHGRHEILSFEFRPGRSAHGSDLDRNSRSAPEFGREADSAGMLRSVSLPKPPPKIPMFVRGRTLSAHFRA